MKAKNYSPFSKNTDFSNIDHIVIGSGIGGLTAATWLAKTGKKVVVFERHYVPGGFTHSFKRKKGFQWDVGVHYVGNVGKKGSLRMLFDFITNHKLDWEFMGETYDIIKIGDDTYEFKAGVDNFKKQLIEYFPSEEKAINEYLMLITKASNLGSAFFFEKTFKPFLSASLGWVIRKIYKKYSQKTTLEVLESLTTNKRLIAVLCAQCGNYGLTPKHSSFAAHAIVINHFLEGGYYPIGGTDQLSHHILDNLTSHDGEIYVNAEVQKIVIENKKVKGIIVNDQFIECPNVISNVGVDNTFNKLLSEKEREKCNFNLDSIAPSTGHMCLYVGLDQSDKALNLPKNNLWFHDNEEIDNTFDKINLENASSKFAYISFPSAKDSKWEEKHPNSSTIQALTVGHYDWFKAYEKLPWMKRGKAYEELKTTFKNSMLEKLYELYPQIKGHVISTEVSSPLSTKHFSNYQHGEIYGLAHTPKRFTLPFLRPETKIKGLLLTGQDITIVGVAGAMLSGMLCAITVLKFGVWRLFKEMKDNEK